MVPVSSDLRRAKSDRSPEELSRMVVINIASELEIQALQSIFYPSGKVLIQGNPSEMRSKGVGEVAGALGLMLPRLTRIQRGLTLIAACADKLTYT